MGLSEDELMERKLNLIEMVIRNFDCWLSCAAHLIIKDEHDNVIVEKEITIGSGWSAGKKLKASTDRPLPGSNQLLFFIKNLRETLFKNIYCSI